MSRHEHVPTHIWVLAWQVLATLTQARRMTVEEQCFCRDPGLLQRMRYCSFPCSAAAQTTQQSTCNMHRTCGQHTNTARLHQPTLWSYTDVPHWMAYIPIVVLQCSAVLACFLLAYKLISTAIHGGDTGCQAIQQEISRLSQSVGIGSACRLSHAYQPHTQLL